MDKKNETPVLNVGKRKLLSKHKTAGKWHWNLVFQFQASGATCLMLSCTRKRSSCVSAVNIKGDSGKGNGVGRNRKGGHVSGRWRRQTTAETGCHSESNHKHWNHWVKFPRVCFFAELELTLFRKPSQRDRIFFFSWKHRHDLFSVLCCLVVRCLSRQLVENVSWTAKLWSLKGNRPKV